MMMYDVVHCNQEQAEKILKAYFSHKPVVTRVVKNDDDIYFIEAKTIPGNLRTSWQYRPWLNIRACFGSVYKGENRRYDLDGDYSEELMKPLNEACEEAIREYESGNDIFQSEEMQEVKATCQNINYKVTKSNKRGYIWTIIILFITLIFALLK